MIGYSAILFVVALIGALVLTPIVRTLARRVGALDHPDSARKLHTTAIPKMGGIAVVCGFYLSILLILPVLSGDHAANALLLVRATFIPTMLILALGIADDIWALPPAAKLAVQLAAGAWICSYPALRIAMVSNPFGAQIGTIGAVSVLLTLAWIVLITNAFNIVDGMDGLASGVAFVATICLFVAAIQYPDRYTPLLVAPLAGALVGFLRYNFNPASIFLGDSGSLTIGFLIAVLSLVGENKSSTAIAVAAPLLLLALPVLEMALSIARRFLRGQPVWEADAEHIHHQLLRRGFSARRVVLVLYAGSALFGVASLLLVDATRVVGGVITIVLVSLAWVGIQQLGYSEFAEVQHAFKRGFFYQRRIIQNSIYVRKLEEELRDVDTLDEAWPLLADVLAQLLFTRAELLATAIPAGEGVVRTWVSSDPDAAARDCTVVSVHLASVAGTTGRVMLWRQRDEERLHSELAVLVDVISASFGRLLAGSVAPSPAGTSSVSEAGKPGR